MLSPLLLERCSRKQEGERQVRHQGTATLTCAVLHRGTKEDGSFPQRTLGDGDGLVAPGSHPGGGHRGGRGVFRGARVDLKRETCSGDPIQRGAASLLLQVLLPSTQGHGGHHGTVPINGTIPTMALSPSWHHPHH